jgi:hypothetical protein
MLRTITTKYGTLLADVQQDKGQTVIFDGPNNNFKPIAVIGTTDRAEVLRSLQRLGTLFNLRKTLEGKGIKFIGNGAEMPVISAPNAPEKVPEKISNPVASLEVKRRVGRPRKNPEAEVKVS